METPLNCLICNCDLDTKPIVFNENDKENENSKTSSQFQLGLQLFCKLLKIGGNIIDKVISVGGGGHGEIGFVIGPPPCCKQCWLAFEQMLQLQQSIEQLQVDLMGQLDKLKAALQTSIPRDYEEDPLKIPPDDIFGQLRDQLLSCVRKSSTPTHQPSQRRLPPPSKSSTKPDSVFSKTAKEYQPCSVTLKRLPVNHLNSLLLLPKDKWKTTDITFKQEIPSFQDPAISPGDIDANIDGGRSIRKSKQKAFQFIQSNHDDDEDEYPWESEAKPIPEHFPNQIYSTCGTRSLSLFSLISPDILLYRYTLIKVSQGYTHFTCQEPECPSPIFSDCSLNWNNLFSLIADHIKNVHISPPPQELERNVKCPLCPITLSAGHPLRAHLIGTGKYQQGHRIETVACEICWRPIRNIAYTDAYQCHLWHHKNDQEQDECPEGPPKTILYKAKANRFKSKQFKKLRKWEHVKIKRGKPKPEVKVKPPKPKKKAKLKTKFVEKVEKVPKIRKERNQKSFGKAGNSFSQIRQDSGTGTLLLYKYTLLKASYGVSLTCQESNCNHITNGTDFTAFETFKTHVNTCHDATKKSETIPKCPLCSEQLHTCFGYRHHLLFNCSAASSTKNNYRLICTVCWRPVSSSSTLEYHQWLHKSESEKESVLNNAEEQPPPTLVLTKEKEKLSQLKCRHCQRGFDCVNNLKAHEATHVPKEQRKKYMCHQCPKLFLSPVAVRGHVEREHERELMRIRTCPICNKEFNWRDGYKFRSHLRSHRNERPFVCEICGMAFLNTRGLKNHIEYMHGNRERSFQCEFCEMGYLSRKNLTRHRKSKHKDKVGEEKEEEMEKRLKLTKPEYRADFIGPRVAFPCPVCERVFPLRSRMKKHWEKSCKNKKLYT